MQRGSRFTAIARALRLSVFSDSRGVRLLQPLLDNRTIEAPFRTDAETRESPVTKQPVNRRWMHAKELRELRHGHDLRHRHDYF